MKTLIFGIVLILLIGVAGFFYRNVMENSGTPEPVACTMDAKVCPDGSSVGRTGPSCEFAPCPVAKVEFPEKDISFVLPSGYTLGAQEPGADGYIEGQLSFYEKPGMGGIPHFIGVYSYPIPEGKTGDDIILENTRYQPADMQAEDFDHFDTVVISGNQFRMTVIERFEAQVVSSYFLKRADDVLMFQVIERDVTDWMEPSLEVRDLPEHQALEGLLGSLESN